MKITKLGHSCLLVEMPTRTALFDPGGWSTVDVKSLEFLDDIIITHVHGDHFDLGKVQELKQKFPEVRITAAPSVVEQLTQAGLTATDSSEGIKLFDALHEPVEPLFPTPDNIGIHYLDKLTHPGDSLRFEQTCPILALPITAPWGATVDAVKLALELSPKYVIPIHDWHWSDEAQQMMYQGLMQAFEKNSINFISPINGQPFNLDV